MQLYIIAALEFMTIDSRISYFSKIIYLYWNPELDNSFCSLDHRLIKCEKQAQEERELSLAVISKAIPNPEELKSVLAEKRGVLKGIVEEVRKIEKALSDAHQVNAGGYVLSIQVKKGSFPGEYDAFTKRLDRLIKEINLVYRNALYPFLLVLQNGEKGWDPQELICRGWDLCYWWKSGHPRKEIVAAFPFT